MLSNTEILGVNITTSSKEEVLDYIITGLSNNSKKTVIVTPNPELIMLSQKSSKYKNILNQAQVSLPDGTGVVLASKLLDKGIQVRITGVDFMKSICENVSKELVNIGLFGAQPGVAEKAADCLRKMYPGIKIVYASDLPPSSRNHLPKIHILFVALGSPKQEQWISDHIDEIPAKVIMGVGGAFDMISGKVRRAPGIFQRLGLEWLWRLVIQPWRLKRQLRLLGFVWLVCKEKFSRSNPTGIK